MRQAYQRVMEQIAAAAARSHRPADSVRLVAVTKSASMGQIRELLEIGHRHLGENRVQQLSQRASELAAGGWPPVIEPIEAGKREQGSGGAGTHPPADPGALQADRSRSLPGLPGLPGAGGVRWHMIGHLQRNKAKAVMGLAALIHGVDSVRLAEKLNEAAQQARGLDDAVGPSDAWERLDVLIEVNISGEESKHGASLAEARNLVDYAARLPGLRVRGLMTMAPYSDNPENARPIFARGAELFAELRGRPALGGHFDLLSMGMSGDFMVAIEEGANLVRVGTALFGPPRPPGS
ncbi:MAG: YggS family pyridoxal phosphate-dependent enzyme [Phycisphaeraceae bacterium]|nr:YggS family pyridoxal phosphate-dependent enzyme [Phycisphaeraceae bacterium]